MGKIIPFQKTDQSIETLTNSLLLNIREGKFNQNSSTSKGVIKHLETCDSEETNAFLLSIAPLVESIEWKYKAVVQPDPALESLKNEFKDDIHELINRAEQTPQLLKIRNNIYNQLFSDDPFLDKLYELFPFKKDVKYDYWEVRRALLGKTSASDSDVQPFLSQCFRIVISRYGLLEQLMYMDLFSSFSLSKELSDDIIRELLKKRGIEAKANIPLFKTFQKEAEKNLSARFTKGEIDFVDLYRLLILRYELQKDCNDVCNALIQAVRKAKLDDILRAFESDTDFSGDNIDEIQYIPKYSQEASEFHHDLYIALHEEKKYNNQIAVNAVLLFDDDLTSCPLGFLVQSSIHTMETIPGRESSACTIKELIAASMQYFEKSLYEEAMICFKTALFNTIDLFGVELRDRLNMSFFKDIIRKLNAYEKSITFLSKFRKINEYGFPLNQGVMNEIEITKAELEYEYESKKYHNIDKFYELVAREDFPAIQLFVGVKDEGRFVLTGNQLQILLKKIQEKSDIIQGLKSISAKCDMLMYMHREVYDKQSSILEVINESKESIESLINENTDKILENIHRRNESFTNQSKTQAVQEYYCNEIGSSLWGKLDENTRKYLMLARYLDVSHQYSPADEFGFIAIEFALAIENEFKRKIIDILLGVLPYLKYNASDRVRIISKDSKITLGEICLLLDKAKKVKSQADILWPLNDFILKYTAGKQKVLEFKNSLFEIKDKYRNPAAHPSNYSRQLFDSFKSLLFTDGFMKQYLDAIQIDCESWRKIVLKRNLIEK